MAQRYENSSEYRCFFPYSMVAFEEKTFFFATFAPSVRIQYMSDGNFNRALLPSTPYRSGVKMAQQQMRGKAVLAFRSVMKEKFPALSDEELMALEKDFKERLI